MQQSETNSINFLLIENLAKTQYRKINKENLQYGTAGFRTKSDSLYHVLFRMGLLTVLRSQFKKAAIGLMITASHNPEEDNGVKLIDPKGEMLENLWESVATNLVNVENNKVVSTIHNIIENFNLVKSDAATVIIGRDTRSSSLPLSQAAIEGIKAMNGYVKDFGIVTTPQLHYLVACTNTNGDYGFPSLFGYYKKISEAFKAIVENKKIKTKYSNKLNLDAANGVGAIATKEFQKHLFGALEIDIYNDGNGQLNHMCGADYVKIQQIPPINMPLEPNTKCVSIDGDADRIVYYYIDQNKKFHLMDGDRIAILVGAYLKELLDQSCLDLQLGIVQTAYANGGSTSYISQKLKIPVVCSSTGVKHLHQEALKFDIGVYFEANGHGTVIFKGSAVKIIQTAANDKNLSESQQIAAYTIKNLINVINQTVGDALSDMLLVELILFYKDWDLITWESSYYDIPNKQVKIKIQNKNAITTTDAGRYCVTPKGLQERIDTIVAKYTNGRSFVRPSGTEDIVRIYAECEKDSDVQKLAAEVSLAVYELAGGIGVKPNIPV